MKLKYYVPLLNFAFKINLRHYTKGLALDYMSPADEVTRTGRDRPLDRFFEPLARTLAQEGELKRHEDPEVTVIRAKDFALLLVRRCRWTLPNPR